MSQRHIHVLSFPLPNIVRHVCHVCMYVMLYVCMSCHVMKSWSHWVFKYWRFGMSKATERAWVSASQETCSMDHLKYNFRSHNSHNPYHQLSQPVIWPFIALHHGNVGQTQQHSCPIQPRVYLSACYNLRSPSTTHLSSSLGQFQGALDSAKSSPIGGRFQSN